MLSSVAFNFIEKFFESGIRKRITILQDRIDHLFPRLTPEKMLMDISGHSKSSDETMLGLAEKIGDRMQETVLQMKDDIILSMPKVLAPALDSLAKSAEKLADRQARSSEAAIEKVIHTFMDKFGQAGAEQGEMMRDSARNLQELMGKIKQDQENSMQRSDALDEQRQKALTDTIEHISAQFKQFQSVGKKNTQAAQGVVEQQQDVTKSVQKVSDDLRTFAGMIEKVSNQLSEAAKEIKDGNQELSGTSQIMAGAILEATRWNERVSQSNQETSQKLQGLLDRIESSRASAEKISAQLLKSAEVGKYIFHDLKQQQEGYRNALNIPITIEK